jgi:hypothetical protein
MYAVGHLALGYITGKLTAKSLNVNLNLPLIFLASVLPDIDLLIPGLVHRGPLHSALLFSLLFLPIFAIYKKRATPYFIGLIQHVAIGDYLIGGNLQLFWPITTETYGTNMHICMTSLTNMVFEWSLFLISTVFMIKTKDIFLLFTSHPSNIILAIPILTVLLPTIISYPIEVPLGLLIPHIIYLILFTIPILTYLKATFAKAEKS